MLACTALLSEFTSVETIQMWVVVFLQINTCPTCKDISDIFLKKKRINIKYILSSDVLLPFITELLL